MKLLLDTDTCIYALKQREPVLARLLAHSPEDVGLSVISEAELRLGVAKSASATQTLRHLESFLRPLTILPFTSQDALAYAQVRGKLQRRGTPLGPLDTFLAAHALSRDLTLVSNNVREFRRVAGLRVESWAVG